MPKVPSYDNMQVAPTVTRLTPMSNPVNAELATATARQTEQLGQSVRNFGGKVSDIAIDIQEQANRLRVQDAVNQTKEAAMRLAYDPQVGYTGIKGADALNRQSGKPLADEYADQLHEQASKIGDSLSNDAQRIAFQEQAANMLTQFHGDAMRHEAEQFRNYAMSVREGTIANSMNDIGVNYNNPDRINEAIENIKVATYDLGRQKGISAEEIEADTRKFTSQAHRTAIAAALQNNNPVYADQYLKKYSTQMSADDILAVNGVLIKHLDATIAAQTVQQVFQQVGPKLDTPDFDRLMRITHMSESGGRVLNADGTPIINNNANGTRDLGPFQINEKSGPELAKLAGVEWDEELAKTDEAYGFMLAQAYMRKNLQDFGGNVAQAISAYNAGPTATREAINRAAKEGGNWSDYIPASTRERVRRDMAAYQQGGGQYARPTLLEVKQQVRERIGGDNPERLNTALELAEKQYNDQTKAIEQRKDEAVATAMQTLVQSGGGYASLPADVRAAIPPEKVGTVIDFAKKLAAGEDVPTDWALYYQLKSDSSMLANVNLMAVRDRLNDTEFKELINMQGEAKRGTGMTQVRSLKDTLDQYLVEAGINPNPKPDDTENAARVGRVWSAMEARVRERESALGRKLNPDEMQKEAARLMTSVEVNGWMSSSRMLPAIAVDPTRDPVVVPAGERKLIEEALRASGKPVTDESVARLYLRGKLGR